MSEIANPTDVPEGLRPLRPVSESDFAALNALLDTLRAEDLSTHIQDRALATALGVYLTQDELETDE